MPLSIYLKRIFNASIEKFQIGYALDSWDFVYKYLTSKKDSKPDLMEKAGLIIQREQMGAILTVFEIESCFRSLWTKMIRLLFQEEP